ncbi:MAG: MFS transporter [Clostridia bacterium]|jgi:PPP family 3-phenylpropionic acid transporter
MMSRHFMLALQDDKNRFKAIQALYWGGYILYYVYYVYYLNTVRGFRSSEIGALVSITAFVTLISQGFWGYVCDRFRNIKAVVMLLYLCTTVLISIFPLFSHFVTIGLTMALIAFFEPPIPVIVDSWIARYLEEKPQLNYTGIRLWGSLSVALVSVVIGRIALWNVSYVFHLYILFGLLSIFICSQVDFSAHYKEKEPKIRESLPLLLKNHEYVVFVISATLIMTAFRSASLFLPNKVIEVGGNQGHISLTWTISVMSEIPVLLLGKKWIKRFKSLSLFIFSYCMFGMRILLYYLGTNVYMVLLSNAFNGVSFGIFLSVVVIYINRIAPERIKTSAFTLAAACYNSASVIIGSSLGGFILDKHGLDKVYITGLIMNLAGILLLSGYNIFKGSGRQNRDLFRRYVATGSSSQQ